MFSANFSKFVAGSLPLPSPLPFELPTGAEIPDGLQLPKLEQNVQFCSISRGQFEIESDPILEPIGPYGWPDLFQVYRVSDHQDVTQRIAKPTLQAALNKQSSSNPKTPEQIDAAIRQLVSKAITTEGKVIDVFTAAGLPKPDISILSDQFLAEVRGLKHKNVAAELLEKLLKVRSERNLVQSQVFSEKLKKTLNAYHNRAISTMQVIEELIKLAKDLDAATKRGEDMGLTEDKIAFYDAFATNDSAVQAMGDAKLKVIAAELITQVKKSVTIDWTLREGARAKIKVRVKRILNKHGYPPDLQEEAVKTVLQQAELLCAEWV